MVELEVKQEDNGDFKARGIFLPSNGTDTSKCMAVYHLTRILKSNTEEF